jgi:hypothetical protein
MFSMLLVSFVVVLPWLTVEVPSSPGGVTKATFHKIKTGMTAQKIQALIGRRRAENTFRTYDYSELELWYNENDSKRIWVEYETTVAGGKVTRASFEDYSTTPVTDLKLHRVATKEECAAAIDQLLADGRTKGPLEHSDIFTKEIPVRGPRAISAIRDHPDYKSYHLLMAVRGTNPRAYKELPAKLRASVLCSTLKEQASFDDWKDPDSKSVDLGDATDSEKALIECGVAAIPYLLPLLDDHTEAWQSEYEEEPEYEYRRADYAFRYVCWILKMPYSFQPEPADRDKDIATLKKKVGRRSPSGT